MTDEQRNWLVIGGVVLMMVLIFLIGMVLGGMIQKNSFEQPVLQVQPTSVLPTLTSIPEKVFLSLFRFTLPKTTI